MNQHKQAILSGDVNKVVELLAQDSLSAKNYGNNKNISDRTDLVCSMCGKPVQVYDEWLEKASPLDLSKLACSDKCRDELRTYRHEGHWK